MWPHRKEARGVSTPTSLLPALTSNPPLANPNQKPEARSPSAHDVAEQVGLLGRGRRGKGWRRVGRSRWRMPAGAGGEDLGGCCQSRMKSLRAGTCWLGGPKSTGQPQDRSVRVAGGFGGQDGLEGAGGLEQGPGWVSVGHYPQGGEGEQRLCDSRRGRERG